MKKTETKTAQTRVKREWKTPRIASSEVFTKAALSCCVTPFATAEGSSGADLPFCPE